MSHASFQPRGRLRLLEAGKEPPQLSQRRVRLGRVYAHRQRDAPDRAEQVAEHGNRVIRRAFRTAGPGPCAFSARSQISVISSRGSTGARTRFSSPRASSCAMKSRRSW